MATDNGKGIVTVVKGDNLGKIATAYLSTYGKESGCTKVWGSGGYVEFLGKLNALKNVNVITVGQKLYMTTAAKNGDSSSSKPVTNKSNKQAKVTKVALRADSSSGRELYAEWEFSHPNLSHYLVEWWVGSLIDGEIKGKAVSPGGVKCTANWDLYDVPSEYVAANVRVKPVSHTYKSTDSEGKEIDVSYFIGEWSTMDQVDKDDNDTRYVFATYAALGTPSAPDPEIKDNTLTVELDNIPDNVTHVQFQVVKDNSSDTYKDSGRLKVTSNHVAYTCGIESGGSYKVRCRYINANGVGAWSDWSGNAGTKPDAPSGFTVCRARDETSVNLEWSAVPNATSYEIGYATEKEFFEGSNDVSTATTTTTKYVLTNLSSGDEYFFALKAINSNGESGWSEITSVIVGTEPSAPTTWSSLSKVVVGETFTLYWVHNSEDGSVQSKANIELIIDGVTESIEIFTAEQEDDEKTTYYPITTTIDGYTNIEPTGGTIRVVEGATILWRVQTAGATGVYGDWSVQRTIDVYAKPTMSINVMDTNGDEISIVRHFPIHIEGSAGPKAQTPVGYHLSIVSNSYYETVDSIGLRKVVNKGDEVYSKYLDSSSYYPSFKLSAGNIDLENNVTYTVTCIVSMDSGLTGEDVRTFRVGWEDEQYEPNAEIGINKETVTALIRPYCKDENNNLVDGVLLSVYRREFDGSFTELAAGLRNSKRSYITDPHPPLDYARYRIVAISEATGAVSYWDVPAQPVGVKSVVIQWDEAQSTFDVTDDHVLDEPLWAGSMLKLPYNIDISDDHSPDVSLVEYIGRKYPVTYYGTQVGHTASWSLEIPKTDKETLYSIRRLANWMGDVYVREPSGSGYWANITVSYSQTHLKTIIPVKFNVKRVSGGA